MDPICLFAIFADDVHREESGITIDNSHFRLQATPIEPGKEFGVVKLTLWVHVIAEPGEHVLMIAHDTVEWSKNSRFTIEPSHEYSYIHGVEMELPVLTVEDQVVNTYPLTLDGIPMGYAYLVSDRM